MTFSEVIVAALILAISTRVSLQGWSHTSTAAVLMIQQWSMCCKAPCRMALILLFRSVRIPMRRGFGWRCTISRSQP